MRRVTLLAAPALLGLVLLSCGSGPQIGGGAPGTGSATFSIVWPTRAGSRLIPTMSDSIRIAIKKAGSELAATVVARPAAGPATVKFDDLPAGNLTVESAAYPTGNGTGIAQAAGSAPLKIERGKDTPFTITMATTIVRVEITSASGMQVAVGHTLQLTATPRDKDGNQVLVRPGSIEWSSDNHAAATVSNTGLVTGVMDGSANITALEPESGVHSAESVAVGGDVCSSAMDDVVSGCGGIAGPKTVQVGAEATYDVHIASGGVCGDGAATISAPTFGSDTFRVDGVDEYKGGVEVSSGNHTVTISGGRTGNCLGDGLSRDYIEVSRPGWATRYYFRVTP